MLTFAFPSATAIAMPDNDEATKHNELSSNEPLTTDLAISKVLSSEIADSRTQAVPLMPLAYAKDVRRINDELDEEVNGPKPRKHT